MNKKILSLRAEIQADIEAIEQAYQAYHTTQADLSTPEQYIVLGYYLQVIYGLFENLFQRIAQVFENHITDQSRWHAQLLRRMTLDIPGIRPAVISKPTFESLDELRGFRHLFRNAYLLHFDPDRLSFVIQAAEQLEKSYPQDISRFLDFLDTLNTDKAE
jgi:hypothetical protein